MGGRHTQDWQSLRARPWEAFILIKSSLSHFSISGRYRSLFPPLFLSPALHLPPYLRVTSPSDLIPRVIAAGLHAMHPCIPCVLYLHEVMRLPCPRPLSPSLSGCCVFYGTLSLSDGRETGDGDDAPHLFHSIRKSTFVFPPSVSRNAEKCQKHFFPKGAFSLLFFLSGRRIVVTLPTGPLSLPPSSTSTFPLQHTAAAAAPEGEEKAPGKARKVLEEEEEEEEDWFSEKGKVRDLPLYLSVGRSHWRSCPSEQFFSCSLSSPLNHSSFK